ncbi:MAG: metallophosphoesterase [Acidilobaceae archaeon]
MTRVLAVSDIHGRLDVYKKIASAERDAEVIMIAGDVTPYGGGNARELLEAIAEEAEGRLVLAVPGNVDDPYDFDGVAGVVNLHGRSAKLKDLTVVGVGGSPPTPFFTINEIPEDEIETLLRNAIMAAGPIEKLVVLSHAPPYGTRVDVISSGDNVGSHAVRAVIEEFKPVLCICGHIHEARGVDTLGSTVIVNPGPAARGYYAVIKLAGDSITPKLKRV